MMQNWIGEQLVEKRIVTEEQFQMALKRQKLQGGRIGQNLVALHFITEEEVAAFFKMTPQPPQTVEETGLDISFIADLIMKHVLFMGEFIINDVVDKVKLPPSVVTKAIDKLRKDLLLEVKGADQLSGFTYRFSLTDRGKNRSTELFEISRYAGPAPVRLQKYREMVRVQTIKSVIVDEKSLNDAFSHLVVNEGLLKRLGPAVSSGKTMFLYGPAGNGKTAIAEAIGKVLPGTIYLPHAVLVESEIITVYDPVNHIAVQPELGAEEVDQRWIRVKRPVIMAGGELTLKALDLEFNPISKFYEAPVQMKANNGLFIVDDFGRQLVDPKKLLNRWIVPLERRTDIFTLHTGMKFEIPFDQLVVFSTNIEPKDLVDEGFLRRIRYKFRIDHPTLQEYEQIFKKMCEVNGITFKKDVFDYLIKDYYRKFNVKLNACHPRDIIENIVDDAHYYNCSPALTKETVLAAWENYFVEM
jgi:hypothetical protein